MAGLESFYGRVDLADMDVVIAEAEADGARSSRQMVPEAEADGARSSRRKRSRGEELLLPGHRLAVCTASEVLNAQVNASLFAQPVHL
jgi:hypothetical protein